jgi:hypothetical protein
MPPILPYVLFGACVPILVGATLALRHNQFSWKRVLIDWLIFASVEGFWISVCLPSLSNQRAWENPNTRTLLISLTLGVLAAALFLLVRHMRSFKTMHRSRGFDVIMGDEERKG